jgi:hypothetical protein
MSEIRPHLPNTIADQIGHFTGRTWLLPELLDWLEGDGQRLFLLTGGPGTGKSMIMAWLAGFGPLPAEEKAHQQLEQLRSQVKAVHFCVANSGSTDPKDLVREMAGHLTRGVPVFGQALAVTLGDQVQITAEQRVDHVASGASVTGISIANLDLRGLSEELSFNRILRDPLKRLYADGYKEPLLLLVDSLDEALTYTGSTNLVQLMSKLTDIPPQVRLLATTRPDPRVTKYFRDARSLDLIADAPPDEDDVRVYVLNRLARTEGLDAVVESGLAGRIPTAARGIFLYAAKVLDELIPRLVQDPGLDLDALELPDGLSGLYHNFLNRELGRDEDRWGKIIRPVLGLIAVAQGDGLSRAQLAGISGVEVEQALRICRQYLAGELPYGPFHVFHKSFSDFLLEDEDNVDYHIDVAEMNLRIVQSYVDRYPAPQPWENCDDYGLRYLVDHLFEALRYISERGRSDKHKVARDLLRGLSSDDRFLLAKARRLGLAEAIKDLRKLRKLATESKLRMRRMSNELGLMIRFLDDFRKLPQARESGSRLLEALIEEAETVNDQQLAIWFDNWFDNIKNNMTQLRVEEIVHAPSQAVFDTFAGREASLFWIDPGVSSQPTSIQANGMQVGDNIEGWQVVAVESGRMVMLENPQIGSYKYLRVKQSSDTTAHLLYATFAPLTPRSAWMLSLLIFHNEIISKIAQVISPGYTFILQVVRPLVQKTLTGSEFGHKTQMHEELRRIGRLTESRMQRDTDLQKALMRDYTKCASQVYWTNLCSIMGFSAIWLLATSVEISLEPAVLLFLLFLSLYLGAYVFNLVCLRQAERVEKCFEVVMPGAISLRSSKRRSLIYLPLFFLLFALLVLFT